MRAEIISVGSELLLGHVTNSDAAIVARELAAQGIDLYNVQMVGDNPERLLEALRLASSRSDIIITTGGLGPTADDLTKETIAGFAGIPLEEDEAARIHLQEYFGGAVLAENQLRQARLPKGCTIFANDVGTAPGCGFETACGVHILMLPGPPGELEHMLAKYARPYLAALGTGVIHSTCMHVFGMGEGAVANRLEDLMANDNPSVAPYAHGGEMFVKITAKAPDRRKALELCQPVADEIKQRLGDVVYGQDTPSLEQVVVQLLSAVNLTVATAESCTGGLLAKRITDVPGASRIFQLGLITYSNEAKIKELGVPEEILKNHGAVSQKTARAMAENVRKIASADYGMGITGIAGPDGGTPEKPVGLVYIGLADEEGCHVRKLAPHGKYRGRAAVREKASSTALDLLRRKLAGLPLEIA